MNDLESQASKVNSNSSKRLPSSRSSAHSASQQFLWGLTVAGVASTLLTTIFELFQVDVFLRAYSLPLQTYSVGNVIFSIINTANDLAGAWLVDSKARRMPRSQLMGISGFIFAIVFLSPFFRWKEPTTPFWDGAHFVLTTSAYDTLYSFTAILMGSVVTDNHHMSHDDRVNFMASGKIANLLASFVVAKMGLSVFSTEDLTHFRGFLVLLAVFVVILFLVGHFMMMSPTLSFSFKTLSFRRRDLLKRDDSSPMPAHHSPNTPRAQLQFYRVIRDFWEHGNFRAWIGMEMLLECQASFVTAFLKTFVDRLLVDNGIPQDTANWLLSMVRPMKQIAAILCYIPIRHFGYHKVYLVLFAVNFVTAMAMVTMATPSSIYWIAAFLMVYPVATGAVLSAGFHLAMSDMVLEMKRKHALEGRLDEPSLAGLFMGANALFCKPMEAFLPIAAGTFLGDADLTQDTPDERTQHVLFYLLVGPALIFSCLQWLSWRYYTLHPTRAEKFRKELHLLHRHSELEFA